MSSVKDEFDYRYEILLKEIDILQANIRSYDQILFRIKGWSITIFSGFLFFSARENETVYLSFGIVTVLLFWTFDALHKRFQRAFIVRHNKIEHFLRTPEFTKCIENRSFNNFHIPDIGGRFSVKNLGEKTSGFKAAFYWHTSLLYITMLVLAVLVALFLETNT